jgi:hypothetical protein
MRLLYAWFLLSLALCVFFAQIEPLSVYFPISHISYSTLRGSVDERRRLADIITTMLLHPNKKAASKVG